MSGQSKEPWPWQKPKPASHAKRSSRAAGGGRDDRRAAGRVPAKAGTRRGRTPAKPPRSRFRVWMIRLSLAGLLGMLLLVVAFMVAYARTDIPDENAAYQTETSYVYYADGKTVLGKFATQDRDSVKLGKMGKYTADAAIAAEDRSFYTNKGIDPKGIMRAAFSNARGKSTQGASTITQQYVKILYLTSERSYQRKLKEAFVSLKLQRERSKKEILEGYLNTIYFGRGAYGIEAAARAYFGVPAARLNLRQSAALAAVINSPNNYDPAKGKQAKKALFSRYLYVLDGMEEMGQIDAAQYADSSRRLPKFPTIRGNSGYVGQTGYVMEMVREELHKQDFSDAEIDGGGLRITTTIEKQVMDAAAAAVAEQRPEGLPQLHVAVASVDPATGGIKGIYAGEPYERSNGGTNWAVNGHGGIGSTAKPFALAAALDNGYSLKSTFEGNSPLEIGDVEINNQGEGLGSDFGSRISLLAATQKSVNTAFADLTDAIPDGANEVLDTAVRLGVPRRNLTPVLTVTLGQDDVAPVDMANAYASFANLGVAHKRFVVQRVTTPQGEQLYKHRLRSNRAIDEDVARDVTYALEQAVEQGTGQPSVGSVFERPAAGKTGTATNNEGRVRSSWFVGYTPQLATAVMYVRGNGQEPLDGYLDPFYGGTYPARTWTATMTRALEGKPVEDFPPPANIKQTAKDHFPAPTFTPKPKPTKTPKPSESDKPKPTKTDKPKPPTGTLTPLPSETPTPTPTPTYDPCEPPCEDLMCESPCPDPGPGGPGPGNGRTSESSTSYAYLRRT